MRTIFLADAHLDSPHDREYRLLLEFLRGLEGGTATLFIMGDLFDFWLGFPRNPFRRYDAVLEALDSLKRSGCRIVYFEGNHDFHLGPVFTDTLGVEVYREPTIMTVQGVRLYLCHGDQINREDYGYRLLRMLLHNRLTASLLRVVPASAAFAVKERLQHASRSGYGSKSRRWDYRELVRSFGRHVRGLGCDGLVTGHFHLPLCEGLDGTPFMVLSLGAWMDQLHYGELVDGALVQKTYHPTAEEG
jgi:UDP-2,3-diacylglucosamine hydrolase